VTELQNNIRHSLALTKVARFVKSGSCARVMYSRLPWAEQRTWHGSEAYAGEIFRGTEDTHVLTALCCSQLRFLKQSQLNKLNLISSE